jgi:hypothetical protein
VNAKAAGGIAPAFLRGGAMCALPWLALCACLDADSAEVPGYSAHVLDEGADIPSVEDDPLTAMRIAANSGIAMAPRGPMMPGAPPPEPEPVPLHSAYAAGREVRYWDFGEGSDSAEPLWQFRRRSGEDGGAPQEIDHPDLIDSVPGDMGYSSLRMPYLVYVTGRYDGERITSVQALEDALELGLIEEPVAMGVAVNWPVVPKVTTLEMGEGDAPIVPEPVYYRGRVATLLRLGGTAENVGVFALERGSISVPSAYVLRRQNELDALDVVFSVDAGQMGYSSLWQQVDVIVPSDYVWGASRAEGDLFVMQEGGGMSAKSGVVIEYAPSEVLLNRPIRYVAP